MRRTVLAVAIVLIVLPVWASNPGDDPGTLPNIPQLIGKAIADVDSALGKPSDTQTASVGGNAFPRRIYGDGKVEVVFIDGKADWITVYPDNLPFSKDSLQALGLPVEAPTFANSEQMRWERKLLNYKEVALFAGEELPSGGFKIWYAYVYATRLP